MVLLLPWCPFSVPCETASYVLPSITLVYTRSHRVQLTATCNALLTALSSLANLNVQPVSARHDWEGPYGSLRLT